jgi:predicted dehydrogenase
MAQYRVGIIGCGRPWRTEGATGLGQGNVHAEGYKAPSDCRLVAAADIKQDNLDAFCAAHDIAASYLDYRKMLNAENLDIVSICVWPRLHAPMTIDAAKAGVKAIHCEKPMAPTWGEAKEMVAVCAEHGVQLTFNHQRRFGKPFRKAKELLEGGAIGELTRIEAFTSNLYDWGTHWFDMMFFYNDETPAEWVIGQIEATRGQHAANRLIGTEGEIEVWVQDGPVLRMRNVETGGLWKAFEVGKADDYVPTTVDAVLDIVDALKTGREPEISARRAQQATEVIFATYESSRKRGRVDLPLDIDDSPLLSMLESGQISAE